MNLTMTKNELIVSYVFAFSLIFLMVAIAMLMNDTEIILPEIAAMAIAMWVYKEPGWIRQPLKIVIAPTVTAIIGFLINQLPIDYVFKVFFTLVLMMLFLRIIQSNLSPSLATGLLPIVTTAEHWSFIISVIVFSFIIYLGVHVFHLNKGIEKKVKIDYKYMIVFLIIHIIWIVLCWLLGYPQFSIIPPIAVVAYELLQKPTYMKKMAFKHIVVLTISITVGTLLYLAIDSWFFVLFLDMVSMLFLLRIFGMSLPAVFAFPLLPFVFPTAVIPILPIATLLGSVFFFGTVLAFKAFEMKNKKRKSNEVTIG